MPGYQSAHVAKQNKRFRQVWSDWPRRTSQANLRCFECVTNTTECDTGLGHSVHTPQRAHLLAADALTMRNYSVPRKSRKVLKTEHCRAQQCSTRLGGTCASVTVLIKSVRAAWGLPRQENSSACPIWPSNGRSPQELLRSGEYVSLFAHAPVDSCGDHIRSDRSMVAHQAAIRIAGLDGCRPPVGRPSNSSGI